MIRSVFKGALQYSQSRVLSLFASTRSFADGRSPKPDPRMMETTRFFLDPADFVGHLQKRNIDFFSGVPDSLLRQFCSYLLDSVDPAHNIIAANEGNALAIAAGYHLSTGKFPCVYMQNSGLGNITNPHLSLAHSGVYSLPILLMVGWRGEPGKKDEPQHYIQGGNTLSLLTDLGIKFEVLPDFSEGAIEAIDSAVDHLRTRSSPYAFVVKRATFGDYDQKYVLNGFEGLAREEAIDEIISHIGDFDPIVSTTGYASREVYEALKKYPKRDPHSAFLCVGSMGHASSIAFGIAMQKKSRRVLCLDGDGAAIMHMGSMAVIGGYKAKNMIHVIFNNACHESVGGQPTVGKNLSFTGVAKACQYAQSFEVKTKEEICKALESCTPNNGPSLIEIKCGNNTRKNLGRPKETPKENKEHFMKFLQQ